MLVMPCTTAAWPRSSWQVRRRLWQSLGPKCFTTCSRASPRLRTAHSAGVRDGVLPKHELLSSKQRSLAQTVPVEATMHLKGRASVCTGFQHLSSLLQA